MGECIFDGVNPVPTNVPCYVGDYLPSISTTSEAIQVPAPFDDEEWMMDYTVVQVLIVSFVAFFWGVNTLFRKYT